VTVAAICADVAELEALACGRGGARFRLADLQVHRPGDGGLLAAAAARGVEIVGVTEHNDVSGIDELREAAHACGVLLYPGFEVASSEGVHVLCLHEPDATVRRLEERLVSVGLPPSARFHEDGSPRRAGLPLNQLIDRLQAGGEGLCILAHAARSADGVGRRACHVRLSSETLAGLRQAFLDPESRVRFPDEHNLSAAPRVLAARWDGCFLDGEIALSPHLNALIGGRGTAKSTAIETLRHAFDVPIEQPDAARRAEGLLRENFPAAAKVAVLVEVPDPKPTRYVIERTGHERPLVRLADGGEILEGVSPREILRPIVFGQKEIRETAQSLESRLALLDRYCAGEIEPLVSRVAALDAELERTSAEIRQRLATLAKDEVALAGLPALRERKRRFDETGVESKLDLQRKLDEERAWWDQAEALLDSHDDALAEARAVSEPLVGRPAAPIGTPNVDLLRAATDRITGLGRAWVRITDELARDVVAARQEVKAGRDAWADRYEERRAELSAAVAEVAGDGEAGDVEDFLQLDRQIRALRRREELIATTRDEVEQLEGRRRELLAAIREDRRRMFQVRERRAAELTAALGGTVRLAVRHGANRKAVQRFLCELRSGASRTALDALVEHPGFTPAELAAGLRTGDLGRLRADLAARGRVIEQLRTKLTEERLDALERVALDDAVEIELDVGEQGRPTMRPLGRLSAAQRSTAILLLALLEGEGPLILDQPEDDLDDRFMHEGVVRGLRRMKARRQFLVATNDANIPVLGDAEEIVVLETVTGASGTRARVSVQGSIDDDRLHRSVEDVLEGGRDAFELRRRRYGF
jgi:hypothetical protein